MYANDAIFCNITSGVTVILPFEDAQVQYVYEREVASPVITVIIVPFHT